MGIVKVFGLERDSTQFIGSAIQASCRDKLKLTKASVLYGAIKQVVVRVFSVLLLLASVWFWLDGSLPLAYGLILVITSFMVFNDLENARNMELNGNKKAHMKSICPCWILKNRRGRKTGLYIIKYQFLKIWQIRILKEIRRETDIIIIALRIQI